MASASPMNILLITSDQQHYSTLGTVNPRIRTPHLDRLAGRGTRYDRAYCNNPLCSPSRSTIITGQYPSTHGCWTIGVKLPEDVPTVGEVLHEHGYATNLIGKAHFQPLASTAESPSIECFPTLRDLDFWRSFHGPWYGFEHVETCRNHADEPLVGGHYALWMEEKGLNNWRDYYRKYPAEENEPRRRHTWDLPAELHYTTWTADRTIAAIKRNAAEGRAFFTWASFHDPHPDYLVPEPFASMYDPEEMEPGQLTAGEMDRMPPAHRLTQVAKPDYSAWAETPYSNHGYHSHLIDPAALRKNMAVYYGMVTFMDEQIGRILDCLDELGLTENTVIVFTTDHGHYLGQHGLVAKGAFHYEDGVRLPYIVSCPGQKQRGNASDSMQALVDLSPSFLEAAGVGIPGHMQGVSQLQVWKQGAESARDHVIVENRHQPTAVHLRTYIDERYKMTLYRGQPWGELFDLREDPGEVHNLFDDPAAVALKAEVMHRFLNAEIAREPTRMPRIAVA